MSNLPEIRDLKSILQAYYKTNIEILDLKTKLLTAPGENYGSIMLAVDVNLKIDNESAEEHFVAKMCPASQMLCEVFNIQESTKKELGMYVDAIPALANLEKEFGIEENRVEDMFAKCIGGRINLNNSDVVDKDSVLLLENLKVIGYDVGDRLKGFDFNHAKLIIKNLAEFQAVPVALKLLKPEIFKEKVLPAIKGISLGAGDNFNDEALKHMISEVTEILKTNEKCLENMDKLFKSMEHNLMGPYRTSKPREPFATIVHTDFWTNNTMVLENEGKAIHNKIVDLQFPMYGSGVHDLLFFMFSSIMPSVLEPNIDYFIKLYYDNFIQRLSKFKVDISQFSWEAFNAEIKEIAPLELGHILIMFKPILTERGTIEDMSTFDESAMFRKDNVTKDFQSRILDTALTFIDREWI